MAIVFRSRDLIPVHVEFDFNTASIASGIQITTDALPIGWRAILATLQIETQFNAGTTNRFFCGYSASGVEFANNIDVGVAAGSAINLPSVFVQSPLTNARQIWIRYTQTGTAATAGKGHLCILGIT